jgi:hypothetical protein
MRETVDIRAVYKLGYMLETPLYPALLDLEMRSVTMCRVRSISRKDWTQLNPESSETIRQAPVRRYEAVKIWSDLHGDMQSQTEMFWPPMSSDVGGNNNVGPYPMQPQET